jgi:hypothetical protein
MRPIEAAGQRVPDTVLLHFREQPDIVDRHRKERRCRTRLPADIQIDLARNRVT